MSRILLTGASGRVGRALIERLASPEFEQLADRTRVDYERTIDKLRPFLGEERFDCLTRATIKSRYGQTEPARPSRFLEEIPEANRRVENRSKGGGEEEREANSRRLRELAARFGKKG